MNEKEKASRAARTEFQTPRPKDIPPEGGALAAYLRTIERLDSQGRHHGQALERIEATLDAQSALLKEVRVPHVCLKEDTFYDVKDDLKTVGATLATVSDALSQTHSSITVLANSVEEFEKKENGRRGFLIAIFLTVLLAVVTGVFYLGGLNERVKAGSGAVELARQVDGKLQRLQDSFSRIEGEREKVRPLDKEVVQALRAIRPSQNFCQSLAPIIQRIKQRVAKEDLPNCPQFVEENEKSSTEGD
jgi:hypothetical protein